MLDRTRLRPTPSRVRAPSPLDRSNYQHLFNPRQTNSPNNLKPSSIRSIIQNQPSTTTTAPQPPVLHKNLSPANYLTSIIPTPPHPTTTNNTLGSLPSVSVLGTDPSPVLPPASVSVRGGSSGRVQNFTSADETDVSQSSQSPSRPPRNSSSCQTEALIDTSHGQETALIVNTSSDQDKVQPWQSQLLPHIGQISQSDPCTLERANSAAARLDSLARLNGIKPRPSLQSSTSDTCLPPFLMAKHIEETERKAALINLANDLNLYPFANHTGLGFGVGPNGRGVPRLSALQRKALEKMALNRNQSTDVVSHTTSLSRSHTTTCTESSQQPYNPKLTHSSSDSHQRQEARSNLIRKLSSRGNLGSRLRNPPAATLPTSNQDHQPSLPSPPLPGADSQLQFMRPHNTLEREMNSPERALPTLDGAPRRLNSSRSLRSRRSTSDKDITHSQKSLTPVVESNSNTKVLSHKVSAHRHTSSDSQSVNLERRTSQGLRYSGLSISRSRPTSSTRLSASISRSRRSTSENLASSSTVNSIYSSSHLTEVAPSPKKHQTDSDLKSDAALTEKLAGIKRTNSGVSSRIYSRASVSSRIDKSLASGRNSSLISRESLVKKPRGNSPKALREIKAETSTSQKDELDFSISVSEPVSSSGNESSYQERVSRALDEISRGSDASVPSNASADWPSMPNKLSTHTPSQSVLNRAANSAIEEIAEGESISAQFSSSSHPVGTHMPVASAADLARYNDSKLAPFPALFSRTSPPSSPERSKSPIGSTAKVIKDRSHGILSNASNFFHGGNRNRSGGLSNGPGPGGVKLFTKGAETSKLMHQSMNIRSTGEDLEEVADSVGTHLNKEHFERKEGPIDDSILSRTSSTTGSIQSSAIKASSVARQNQILGRLGPFLKPSNEPGRIGRRHSLLNDPPRKLWWHSPVLQVVNPTSVKDRYIFLFNDLLVITKPIIEFEIRGEGKAPKLPITLGSHYFLTKNVVKVQDLRFANLISDGMASNHQSHERGGSVEFGGGIKLTGQTSFTVDFAKNAEMAIQRLIANHGIKDDSSSIGKLLISTPDLDSRQLGDYLSRPEHGGVLKNYLDRLKFSQLKIDDGLRLLLLSLRLPNETEAIERVLIAFGAAWSAANERVGVTPSLAARMALGMIILSEELHHSLHDSMKTVASCIGYPNGIKSEIDFIDSFKNRRNYVPLGNEEDGSMLARNEAVGMSLIIGEVQLDALLKKLYLSVRRDRLIQARATAEETDTIEISVGGDHSDGAKLGKVLPSRLIYQVESDLVTLTLPEPDPHFGIKLFSTGVRFEPAFLSFSESRSCSFRIKGKTIGISQISFIKIGSRAAAYVGLPLISSILVERAFMKDTVQVTFMNHFQASRKYLFSFDGSSSKKEFISLISKAQKSEAEKDDKKARSGPQAVGRVASLQVLRDTLIPNDDLMAFHANPYRYTTIELKPKSKLPPESSTSSKQNNSDLKTETPGASQRVRSNSLSETYIYTTGSREKELQDAIIQRRQAAQLSYLKKKQQKILQERMRKNLEGGKQGLNPYSNSSSNGEVKLEVESVDLIYKKYWRNGEKLVRECEQNSLLPLVLGFLSMGIEQKGGLNANGHYVGLKNR
ncbi:hypothetical protein PPACK8108_LOCUS1091 [Phakopsora pachyrhizi]|uniref:SEC7 domain-containing protein n=1 Tax=Phakopsora pachyrhizi TaxID=170000 RepID=A0AAV0AGW0_PHAPC|nr:hypothetical protein PPACK8108_LOCUS1091 [Phakopsora pachyrhizi]